MTTLHKGDRVKVLKFGVRLSARTGIIQDQHADGKLHVLFGDGDSGLFDASDLEIVVAQLQNPD